MAARSLPRSRRAKKLVLQVALAVASLALPFRSANADASRFDGTWHVTLSCPRSPEGALAYSYEFPAEVKDGVLHGERGKSGEPGWLQLDGRIKPDGSASLTAQGITNIPAYALYKLPKGTPYTHAVTAQFDDATGTGSWVTRRTCEFRFKKG